MATMRAVFELEELAVEPRSVAEIGGKATNLATLVRAGLAVPPGLVIAHAAFTGDVLPPELAEWVLARAKRLGASLIVRSSATIEDSVSAGAPGLFESRECQSEEVLAAIAKVRASRSAQVVAAYARARGIEARAGMAVIVQQYVAGERLVIYTRPPGQRSADEVWIRDAEAMRVCSRGAASPEVAAALAAEAAIGATAGADVELVIRRDSEGRGEHAPQIVQARPIIHPAGARTSPPPAILAFSRAQPEARWKWDARHNPDPLSLAQQGLVERGNRVLDELEAPTMRIVGGYLYYRETKESSDAVTAHVSHVELEAAWQSAQQRMEEALTTMTAGCPALPVVLAGFEQFYRHYTALSPLVSTARHGLSRHLGDEARAAAMLADASPARFETLLAQCARGELAFEALLAEVGDMAPAWDVAVATFAERPSALRAAVQSWNHPPPRGREVARHHRDALPADQRIAFDAVLAMARLARDIGELDDRLYARAHAAVRRTLLRIAEAKRLPEPSDIFYVPLESLLEPALDAAAIAAAAATARAEREYQRRWAMPLVIAGGIALSTPMTSGSMWRGHGAGARVTGIAVRLSELAELPQLAPGSVLVTLAMTPAMAVLLANAVALVSEHGTLLDHGPAMARELGIPCVVGCPGVWDGIGDDTPLWIDGDAGLVVRRDGGGSTAP